MKSYLEGLSRPFLVLAPMEDVTDTVFRRIIQKTAPFDLYMTEFVNVDGLQSVGRDHVARRLIFKPEEQPLIAQIWGSDPDNFYKTTLELKDMGFVGVDINMGCPAKDVVKNGCGGGLINNPEKASQIIDAVKKAAGDDFPVSVKTRIGFKEFNEDWIKHVLSHDLAMLTVHLRTVKEMSLVPAHWDLMSKIVEIRNFVNPRTVIVGNGDVQNRSQAEALAKKYQIDGVMIGRGIFANPYAADPSTDWTMISKKQKLNMYLDHVESFVGTWGSGNRPVAPLNKFCKTYINGFDGAKKYREVLMGCKNEKELIDSLKLFISDAS